ncbi:MAG: type II toxin-antitoxin system CcdA family antitoxin [Candidatus Nanopusillus sp.]|uniref:RHH/CopG DNA binding protein n=1 Tax=Nanobsidianus stetteri TaxID=1294122 RepID=R1G9N2_NANST|nr:RHH/CopG DNA binding protein [Candidatus Nanobsidianus stetteri]
MGKTDVISVRIDKNLKEKAKELGINIKEVVEKALKEEIAKRKAEKIKKLAEKLSELMKDVTPEEFTRLVKETRYER